MISSVYTKAAVIHAIFDLVFWLCHIITTNLIFVSCLLHNYVPGRSLRSSQSNLLCVPSHKLNFGARSFRIATPTIWNSLPTDIHACTFCGSFIRQLKTYFKNAF